MPSKHAQVLRILDHLSRSAHPALFGAVAVDTDGMVLAAHMVDGVNVNRVGSVAATIIGITRSVSSELRSGALSEAILRSEQGTFLIVPAGKRHLLALNLRSDADLDQIRLTVQDAAQELSRISSWS